MPKQKLNSHKYLLFYRGKSIIVRIKREGKQLMSRALDLDFTGANSTINNTLSINH